MLVGLKKPSLGPVRSKAKQRYLAGSRAFRFKDYVGAVHEFSKAIFLDSKNSTFYTARAKAYRELGDFKSALVDFRVASRMEPENETFRRRLSGLMDMMGHLHLEAKAYLAAKQCFTEAIMEEKLVIPYWLHRCVANIHLEDWKAALSDVDRALFLDSRNADAHVLRAKLYWKLGMVPKGNADMTAAVALNPNHPEVVEFEEARWSIAESAYQKGASLMLLHDSAGAILQLNRALELAPDDVKTRVLRAAAYRREGNFADSLRDVEYAARIFREQLRQDREDDEADEGLDAVEHPEISRQRNLTLNAVAVLQHQRGNYGHALTLYNKVIQSETAMGQLHDRNVDSRFLLNRGDTYLKIGQLQQALADFHRAFDSNPRDMSAKRRLAAVHDMFGVQLFNEGLVAQAEVEFSTAIEYNDGVAVFHLHRGNAALYLQKADLAYRDYRRAQELDPDNPEVAQRLAQFATQPRATRKLKATKVRGLNTRARNATLPAPPTRRAVGGRRNRLGNIWEDARKLELARSGAKTGWLEQLRQRGKPLPATLGRARTATPGRRSRRPRALPPGTFVGAATGQLIDKKKALASTSWVDAGSSVTRTYSAAIGADWVPPGRETPTRRSSGPGFPAIATGAGAGAGAGSGPPRPLSERGRPRPRGTGAAAVWAQRTVVPDLPSPVVGLTTKWRDRRMSEIRDEVLPGHPSAEWLAAVLDSTPDYRTTYFEKAKSFAKMTEGKKKA